MAAGLWARLDTCLTQAGGPGHEALCLFYLDAEHWIACCDADCANDVPPAAAGRRLLTVEPLHTNHTATTVRVCG